MKYFYYLLGGALFYSATCLSAPYDAKTGYISQIDVAAGNNMGFRIMLKDTPFECDSGGIHAYLNDTDSNYETFVSVLLAAKMAKSQVKIYTAAGTANHCRISYVSLLES